ncbi:MAG: dihydrodipicolinate synthase family protein [Anaerolineaceae bacterium]|nr:dihydrodipicolinate synthase family protein [Anaerolineaceae bacterium]
MTAIPPLRTRRQIEGISAILLPFRLDGAPDREGFCRHVERTFAAGLVPAINMDTGYASLLSSAEREQFLSLASTVAGGRRFVAGATIAGAAEDLAGQYARETFRIQRYGATPVLFQCAALTALPDPELVEVYRRVAGQCDALIAFELGSMFAPFGKIYSLEVVAALMQVPQITGLKHSSLRREPEWQRLELRDRVRPAFKIYTGNDLAIDMVTYGSDYLLGLSTFAPDFFARRDALWHRGDAHFYALNDVLQYLGQFAFRPPTPAYKHSAAQFLKLRGWIDTAQTHPAASRRPQSDVEVLTHILQQLEAC